MLAVIALAGCAEESAPPPVDDDLGLEEDLEATDTTGVIRGVVVDSAIRPIAGVTIQVQGQALEAVSNENGAFGFEDLEPGTYFLTASRIGYLPVQQSADVVAGDSMPPAVRMLMEQDASFNPYYKGQSFRGFIECTTSLIVVCGLPNLITGDEITGDKFTPTFYYDEGADLIITEMVWETTQPLGPEMYFEMEALDDGCSGSDTFIESAQGLSPVVARVNGTVLAAFGVGGEACGIYHSVFSGDATGGVAVLPVGATVQQEFEFFIYEFHGYLPPDDWQFSVDGDPPPPPSR